MKFHISFLPYGWNERIQSLAYQFERGDWNAFSAIEGLGPIESLEKTAVETFGGNWCLAMANCTSALVTALYAAGVQRGSEVILPAYSWPQTLFPVLVWGAVPVFADVAERSATMDPEHVNSLVTSRTSAILAAHLYGHSADVYRLRQIADHHHLPLIIDAAQGSGIRYDHGRVADFADYSAFSFGRGKLMSVGEGGLLIGKDAVGKDRSLVISQHPLRAWADVENEQLRQSISGLGFNFRLHPWIAALLELRIRQWADDGKADPIPSPENLYGFQPDLIVEGSYPEGRIFPGILSNPEERKKLLALKNANWEKGRISCLLSELPLNPFQQKPSLRHHLPRAKMRLDTEVLWSVDSTRLH